MFVREREQLHLSSAARWLLRFRDAAGSWTDPLPLADRYGISEYATRLSMIKAAVPWPGFPASTSWFIVTYTKAAGFSRTTKLYHPAMMPSGGQGPAPTPSRHLPAARRTS